MLQYEGKEIFDQFPKIVKENEYVLILNRGTIAEKLYSTYDSELEAYKVGSKLEGKKTIIRANVTYTDLNGFLTIHDYEEII